MVTNRVFLTHKLMRNIHALRFPLFGNVRVTDSRKSCDDTPGPCRLDVEISLEVVQFERYCPQEILQFTPTSTAQVYWTTPRVQTHGRFPLITPTDPGSEFEIGSTDVVYTLPADPSQTPGTIVTCAFVVC
jgi:hypothetical protein